MLRDPEKTVGGMLDKQRVAMLGTVDGEGYPNVKCMLRPRKRNGLGEIFFSTNTSSRHVAQLRGNAKACVYVYDGRFFRGAMLRGRMEVLEDPASKASLWQDGDTQYYPGGVDDPDYCVLRFVPEAGRYYSNFKSQDFVLCAKQKKV